MGKSILIVTGSDYTPQIYKAFWDTKAMGHKLYLLSDGCFEPPAGLFEKHFTYDLRLTQDVIVYMGSQPEKFDAVTIKTSEWLTPLTALLAKKYGCIGNTPLTAFYCRSKYHMRQIMKQADVPIPAFQLARNYEELLTAINHVGIPCVAKPVGGNASYGTFMIRSKSDLGGLKDMYDKSILYLKKKAVRDDIFAFNKEEMDLIGVKEHVDMVTDYIVEEFMDGHEISIDSLTQNGETTLMGIADQVRMKPPYFVQLAEKMPYVCSEEDYQEIESLVKKTVQAIGITDSASHTEIIFTPEGPKIVEIGCRIGGDNIHDAVYQTTGYNLMFESIMIALGEKRRYSKKNRCFTAMEYLLPVKKGTVQAVNIPESLYKDPEVTETQIDAVPGLSVDIPPESFDFLGYVQVKGKTPKLTALKLSDTLAQIKIVIE